MASGPIPSWQIDGETVKRVRDFIFLHSKITADGHCSHEIKRRLLLGRKVEGYSRTGEHCESIHHNKDVYSFHTTVGYKFYSSSQRL